MYANTVELLAPAKNKECAFAAIQSGADAVYIGGPSFGARVNAPNSLDDIKTICDYAHEFGVKIHITLNTILTDDELKAARAMAFNLYDVGVDALIIQDPGLINGPLPPLELHASTQQNNDTPEKVKFLEDLGYTQAVLARELSISDIEKIHAHAPNIKLEAFIHGALCVGVSGRCYLSSAVTGRSANRGECAQLCRVKQNLYLGDGTILAKDKYLLSMRDLNQSQNIRQLLNAGIRSFKIEGRLKDENYVRNVTAWYRTQIDKVLQTVPELKRSSFGTSSYSFTPDVTKSFNRGFTDYNTHEKKANYACFDAPGFVGNQIGKLHKMQKHILCLALEQGIALHNGDSLNYYDKKGELQGFRISKMLTTNTFEVFQELKPIALNTIFYRNRDNEFEKSLTSNSSIRRLKLELTYKEDENGVSLLAIDETNAQAQVSYILEQKDISSSIDKLHENLKNKLGRLGDSVYTLTSLTLNTPYNWFVPVSVLNNLRREVLSKLSIKKRTRIPHTRPQSISLPTLPTNEQNLGFKANILNSEAAKFYEKHGAKNITAAFETRNKTLTNTCNNATTQLYTQKIPHLTDETEVLISKHCLRYCFNMCPLRHKKKPQDMYLEIGSALFKLDFDCKKCLMYLKGPIKNKPF